MARGGREWESKREIRELLLCDTDFHGKYQTTSVRQKPGEIRKITPGVYPHNQMTLVKMRYMDGRKPGRIYGKEEGQK